MPDVYFQSSSSFPQTSANRTRAQASTELAEYVGGLDSSEVLVRAGRAWDAAVREFNTVAWRFNRRTQDITLVVSTPTYSLSSDFRSHFKAMLLDSNSKSQWWLEWVPYENWVATFGHGSSSTSGLADYYTALNTHNTGLVQLEPSPGTLLTYPTLRIQYFCRIALASADSDRLNVPVEVDEAIFQLAVVRLVERTKGEAAEEFRRAALFIRQEVEREHRDWPEVTGWGANG